MAQQQIERAGEQNRSTEDDIYRLQRGDVNVIAFLDGLVN